jgi:hypothetical protein
MARPSARLPEAAARRTSRRKAKVVRLRKLARAEHELPDGRYLLAYGYETPAPRRA